MGVLDKNRNNELLRLIVFILVLIVIVVSLIITKIYYDQYQKTGKLF